jgi:hypothetical protein
MKLQDFLKKVPGYVQRVLDGVITSEQLLSEIQGLPRELTEPVRSEIVRQFSRALDLTEKSDPLIPALEILAEPGWTEVLAEAKRCRSEYRKARGHSQEEARARILAGLATVGIRGSAVVPRLKGDESWEAEDRKLRAPCEERLAALREALTADEY